MNSFDVLEQIAQTTHNNNNSNRKIGSDKRDVSWIDTLPIKVKTDTNQPSFATTSTMTDGFLYDVFPLSSRNCLLAQHNLDSKRAKREMMIENFKRYELNRLSNELSTDTRSGCYTGRISIEEDDGEIMKIDFEHFLKRHKQRRTNKKKLISSSSDKHPSTTASVITPPGVDPLVACCNRVLDNVVRLNEPRIQRISLYDKIAKCFEHFYNDHDGISIVSLILYPLCYPYVTRTIKFWANNCIRPALSSSCESDDSLPQCSSSSSTCSSDSSISSFPDTITPDDPYFEPVILEGSELLASTSMNGLETISASYYGIFDQVPDSVIVFPSPIAVIKSDEDNESNDGDGSYRVRNDYIYFFKLPVSPTRFIDVEIHGYIEITFSRDNMMLYLCDHMTPSPVTQALLDKELKKPVPQFTMKSLLQYMGYT